MAKKIGALWVRKQKDGSAYMTGVIDLGVIHGEIQIVAWKNKDKKEQKQPDYTINLSEPKKEERGEVAAIDIDAPSPFPNEKTSAPEDDIDVRDIPFD
jgi:hypothetical protein